ncbi:UNVERIFIED_CONTAM: hypothetical protein PYX00_008809 [Menopon gallinae]|uniref:XLF-like coiled-coil region domain-containing protein n=1 Tax=Menopon gallinae TaxID=328185 RepID=A0AAW2HQC7_9NEOP
MWTSLSLDNLILKWKKTEFGCNVHVSDFIHIWSLNLKNEEIEVIFKLFQELLLPMITVAATLQLRENKLIEIITRKDAEINEYKRENTPIKRNHLITKKFNADRFKERGFAENDSSVSAVESNPSLIFDLIDIKLFSSFMDSDINNSNVDKKNINENLEAECIITNSNAISSHNSANDKEEDLIGL